MAIPPTINYVNPTWESPGVYSKKGGYLLRDKTGRPILPISSRGGPGAIDPKVQAVYQAALRSYNAQQAQAVAVAVAETTRVQSSITSIAQRFAGKPSVQPIAQDNIAGPTSAGGSPVRAQPGNTQVQPNTIAGTMRRRGRRSIFSGMVEASDALGA